MCTFLASGWNKITLSAVCPSGANLTVSRRHHLALACWFASAFAAWTVIWVETISWIPDRQAKKIPHPVPKFWCIPLPGEQSNPVSRQDILCFPNPASYFGQMPDPENTHPDSVQIANLSASCQLGFFTSFCSIYIYILWLGIYTFA